MCEKHDKVMVLDIQTVVLNHKLSAISWTYLRGMTTYDKSFPKVWAAALAAYPWYCHRHLGSLSRNIYSFSARDNKKICRCELFAPCRNQFLSAA